MRWADLANAIPPDALQQLAWAYPSVEAFLVSRSKALGTSASTHGGLQDGAFGALPDPHLPHLDPAALAAVEAAVCGRLAPEWRSALDLRNELASNTEIITTGIPEIDDLIVGGMCEGTVVEAAGETGSGKTQLCLSAAAATALRGEPVLYVDTTGAFSPKRLAALALYQCGPNQPHGVEEQRAWRQDIHARVLRCVSVLRASNVYELLGQLDCLEARLSQEPQPQGQPGQGLAGPQTQQQQAQAQAQAPGGSRPRLRLLVVDSVSAVLSTVLGHRQHNHGRALLTAVGRSLKQLAERHRLAVLVTNHVTSVRRDGPGGGGGRRGGGGGGGGGGADDADAAAAPGVAGLKPALGEHWRPQPHTRIQLAMDETRPPESGYRRAVLTASQQRACGHSVVFRIPGP